MPHPRGECQPRPPAATANCSARPVGACWRGFGCATPRVAGSTASSRYRRPRPRGGGRSKRDRAASPRRRAGACADQIRGVGRCTALLLIAEVGDVSRFPDAQKLCGWARPTIRSSDGQARLGYISRQCSRILRVLVESARWPSPATAPCGPRSSGCQAAGARDRRVRKILTRCYYGLATERSAALSAGSREAAATPAPESAVAV
jgi:hypothetical protein